MPTWAVQVHRGAVLSSAGGCGASPVLGLGDDEGADLDDDRQAGLQQQTPQHRDVNEAALGPLGTQLLSRASLAHQDGHGGGDDQVEEQELQVTQVRVQLGQIQ